VTKAILVADFLRARARWRLDSAGPSALQVARSVVSLLDTAAYVLHDLPDDDPDLLALEAMGCFGSGAFDPGPEGIDIVKQWQLADEPSAHPRDLLAELVRAAHSRPGAPAQAAATPGIPRPATTPEHPAWAR
jgi:hypothetical protein